MSSNEFVPYDLIVLLSGISVSLKVFLVSSLFGGLLGLGLALFRHYRFPLLSQLSVFVSEFLKNSPVLVQLFLIYFGLPIFLSMDMSAELAATITLTGNTAAFVSVIIVTAMAAVDKGQIEAARSFGISENGNFEENHHASSTASCHCTTGRSCGEPTSGNVTGLRYRGYGHYQSRCHFEPTYVAAIYCLACHRADLLRHVDGHLQAGQKARALLTKTSNLVFSIR